MLKGKTKSVTEFWTAKNDGWPHPCPQRANQTAKPRDTSQSSYSSRMLDATETDFVAEPTLRPRHAASLTPQQSCPVCLRSHRQQLLFSAAFPVFPEAKLFLNALSLPLIAFLIPCLWACILFVVVPCWIPLLLLLQQPNFPTGSLTFHLISSERWKKECRWSRCPSTIQ